MKTKLVATLLLCSAPAWVAAQETLSPSVDDAEAPSEGSAQPAPEPVQAEPAEAPTASEPAPAPSEPEPAADPAPDAAEPAPATNWVPADPPSAEPASTEPAPTGGWSPYAGVRSGRGSRDGLSPLERTNRNELGVFAGRQDVRVAKEDRHVLGYEDESAIMGASLGLRYRNAMGLGAELAYVAWSTSDAADVVSLAADGFDASVRYAWDPIGVVSLYGQAGAGGRWVDLELDEGSAVMSDSAATWSAHAALGFSVRYAGSRGFVELYNDHGYEAHGDLVFDNARFDESEARPVDLGSVSLGGYRMRWGFSGGVAW